MWKHNVQNVKKGSYILFFNPQPAELLKWHDPFLELFIITFYGYQDENFKLVSQQYRAWSDCTEVQAGLALYWWQRLITFGFKQDKS